MRRHGALDRRQTAYMHIIQEEEVKKMVTHITLHIHTQTAYHSTYIICVFMGAWHKMDGRQILLKRARARARALNKRI